MTLEEIDNGPFHQEGDNDPINGRYVNARHKQLLVENDWMEARGIKDESREREIHAEETKIVQEEADKGNPVALFYLGVNYLNGGGGVGKDITKGRALLERANELGVKRSMDFLMMYFKDYGGHAPIR